MADYQLFIDGEYCDAASGETFATYEPATNAKFADVAKAGREDAERAIKAARKAFDEGPWPRMSGDERAAKLNKVADLIEANSEKLAEPRPRDGGGTMKKAMFADMPGAPAPSSGSPAVPRSSPTRSSSRAPPSRRRATTSTTSRTA